MHLSVTIITYNEEKNIEKCLKSVMEIADEIIIVDSYSTDNTIEICQKYSAKIYQKSFGGYGRQKLYAVDKATYNFILSLDADEVLSDKLLASIKAIKRTDEKIVGYTFNRLNYYCGKPIRFCGWYPDIQLRLFDKRFINWNDRDVHETVEYDKQKIIHINGDLLHYTCSSIQQHVEKEEKYARLNAGIIADSKKNIYRTTPYLKSTFRFFKTYILKLGFLDGYYGYIISKTVSYSSYLKYKIVLETRKKNKN